MIRRAMAAMLMAATLLTTGGLQATPANGDANPGPQMFGQGRPFAIGDLPRGRLRARIESLPRGARIRAMDWLHSFDFPHKDLDTMEVDDEGGVLYVDPAPVLCDDQPCPEPAAAIDPTVPSAPAASADDAFVLHSRPGSDNVVFLDFDGHSFFGTAWGSGTYHAEAFDLDGNPAGFNAAERAAIAEIWHRVAEDFAPFDIDVTTEEPAAFGPRTGRVLITSRTQTDGGAMPHSTAGGVAYVGVWGRSNYASYYSPALVYYDNLARTTTYIAETSAHEFGHNLGLSHDGTSSVAYYAGHGNGATSWAPIMGNSFSRNVTQWSNGEYAGANNTQDDIAILTDALFLAADDHGDTPATATPLSIDANGAIAVSDPEIDPHNLFPENKGVIDSVGDWDYFTFAAGAGTLDIRINPSWQAFFRDSRRGANLDVRAVLLDAAANIVAESDPIPDTHAGISVAVAPGTYYLAITGAGNGNYSNYASQGQYFVSGSVVTQPNLPPTSDFGFACQWLSCSFSDNSSDSDGNVVAWAWNFGDTVTSTARSPSHSYAAAGTYTVTLTVTDDAGATNSATASVTVAAPNAPPTADFGSSCQELACTFVDSSSDADGDVVAWSWDFGDGSSAATRNPAHGYGASGTYTVILTVTDNAGATDTISRTLTVSSGGGGDPVELVVDNLHPNTQKTGTWARSGGANPWAGQSVYNNGGSVFRWLPAIPQSGRYQVYAWWTYHANRSSTVPYRIGHAAGVSTVTVNQRNQALGGRWVLLGEHDFTAGAGYVEVSSANGQASADAVRLVRVAGGTSPPPGDTQAPAVGITSPAPNAGVSGSVTVQVDASDDSGVARVELYADGQLLATDQSAPYAYAWDTTQHVNSNVTLTARAFDAAGNEGVDQIVVTVDNGAAAIELVVDNLHSNTQKTGTWARSGGANPWAGQSVYNNGGSVFRWLPAIPQSGRYQVYAWWTYHANRSSTVPYRIGHVAGVSTVTVNQRNQALGGRWVLLGAYDFTAGAGYVEVSSANGQASADAVRLVRVP